MERVEGNQQNVDAAQMQGKVGGFIMAADAQHHDFEQLIPDQQSGKQMADPDPSVCRLLSVKDAATDGEQQKAAQPGQMEWRIRQKSFSGGNGMPK